MSDGKTQENRRDFFRSLGRYAALGLIGVGGGVLASRRGVDREGHRCQNRSVCCNCGVFGDCRLPAALSAKQNGAVDGSAFADYGVTSGDVSPARCRSRVLAHRGHRDTQREEGEQREGMGFTTEAQRHGEEVERGLSHARAPRHSSTRGRRGEKGTRLHQITPWSTLCFEREEGDGEFRQN